MRSDTDSLDRRKFLKVASAGSVTGMATLAGCTGGGSETDNGSDNGSDQSEQGNQQADLPSYTYLNNAQSYNPPRHDAINLIADRFGDLGLDVDVEVLEWGTLYNRVSVEYDYSFSTWHTFFTIDPVLELNSSMNSENVSEGDGNYAGYQNEEVDQLMADYLSEPDADTRVGLVHDLQQTLMEDVPQMPVVHMPMFAIFNNNQVGNWQPELSLGYNSYWTMVNLEMQNGETQLKGYWPESLSTMNVLGHNDENKHTYQFEVMYDTLLRLDNNGEINTDVSLATDYTRVDETTVEYTIRTDHSFHDGEALTVEDVAFTYNYLRDNDVPIYSVQSQYIDSAETVDDSTVRINLTEPFGPFNTLVATQIPILPEHKWADRDDPSQLNIEEPVGSGPLQFSYWNKGTEFGLERFDDHFAPVDFEERFWRIIPEASTVWELLNSGELNYEPFGRIDRQLNQNQDNDQITVEYELATSFWHFTPNERQEGLDDPAVRKALVNALPRTGIVEQILYGFPETGFNIVSPAFGPLHTEDVTEYEESLEQGRQRLQDAGYL